MTIQEAIRRLERQLRKARAQHDRAAVLIIEAKLARLYGWECVE